MTKLKKFLGKDSSDKIWGICSRLIVKHFEECDSTRSRIIFIKWRGQLNDRLNELITERDNTGNRTNFLRLITFFFFKIFPNYLYLNFPLFSLKFCCDVIECTACMQYQRVLHISIWAQVSKRKDTDFVIGSSYSYLSRLCVSNRHKKRKENTREMERL